MTDLPESFDQWPREDQLTYLANTRKKRELIDAVIDALGADVDIDGQLASAGLKKDQWAAVLVAVLEAPDA